MIDWIPDGFKYLDRLGNGSYGHVDLLYQESNEDLYALKVLTSEVGKKSAEIEIKALKMINSPFVTRIHHAYHEAGSYCFLIDPSLGGSLRQRIANIKETNQKFTKNEILHIIYQILLGLSSIHRSGVVHRDLCPSNILFVYPSLDELFRIQIIDFGCGGYDNL